jgi:hypothetical protein
VNTGFMLQGCFYGSIQLHFHAPSPGEPGDPNQHDYIRDL